MFSFRMDSMRTNMFWILFCLFPGIELSTVSSRDPSLGPGPVETTTSTLQPSTPTPPPPTTTQPPPPQPPPPPTTTQPPPPPPTTTTTQPPPPPPTTTSPPPTTTTSQPPPPLTTTTQPPPPPPTTQPPPPPPTTQPPPPPKTTTTSQQSPPPPPTTTSQPPPPPPPTTSQPPPPPPPTTSQPPPPPPPTTTSQQLPTSSESNANPSSGPDLMETTTSSAPVSVETTTEIIYYSPPPWWYEWYEYYYSDLFEEDVDESFASEKPENNSETRAKIEYALDSYDVRDYIANLPNALQRYAVLEGLRRCPKSELCGISIDLTLDYEYDETCCRTCSCQQECLRDGDCCADSRWLSWPSVDSSRAAPTGAAPSGVGVINTCIMRGVPQGGHPVNGRIERVKALTGCPEGVDEELVFKCNQNYYWNYDNITLYDVIFVSNDIKGVIYRNIYCAICNGEHTQSLTLWQPELACGLMSDNMLRSTEEVLPHVLFGFVDCDVEFRVPGSAEPFIESCYNYVARCNVTGLWQEYDATIEAACESYGHPVKVEYYGTDYYYRNPICAFCNGMSLDRVGCDFAQTYIEKYTFSGLLRLAPNTAESNNDAMECPQGFKYDRMKGQCREIHCADGREFVDERCMVVAQIRNAVYYKITLRVQPVQPMPSSIAYEISADLGNLFYDKITSIGAPYESSGPDVLLYISSCRSETSNDSLVLNSTYLDFFDIRFEFLYYYKHYFTQYVNHFLGMNDLLVGLDNSSMLFLVSNQEELGSRSYDFSLKSKIIYSNDTRFATAREFGANISDDGSYVVNGYINENNFCIVPSLFTSQGLRGSLFDVIDLRPCPMFNISLDEFNFIRSMDGLYIAEHDIDLDISEYSLHERSNSSFLMVCIDTYNEKFTQALVQTTGNANLIELIVSIIFVAISIACLIFSLFTYCLFGQLRTLPGKNNMALITWLMVAQVMYLLGNFGGVHRGTLECKVVGLVTHFSWLAAVFWMQICTFHMFRVLSKMRVMTSSPGYTKYVMYHVYSITMSTVCVLVNVLVSMVTTGNDDMGYAARTCYISSQTMIAWTFGLPTAFVIFSNITLFGVVVVKLKRVPDISKNVKNDRNYMVVFAKLSTVTGATWAFGLTYMWTGLEFMSYIFIVLNASQGLFIMVGFVCNKRTLGLYKELTTRICSRNGNNMSSTD